MPNRRVAALMGTVELEEIVCPFCGHPGNPRLKEGGWTGRECPNCRLIFVSPRPNAESVERIYVADASRERVRQHVSSFWAPLARLEARRVVRMLGSLSAPGRLLELGPGGGAVVHAARQRGWDVGAVELNPEQAAFIRDRLRIPCWSSLAEANGTWDVVYHRDVLSHFPDAVEAFTVVRGLLRPGGIHVFETGNGDFERSYDNLFASFQFPDHLYFYSKTSLPMLLERSGFELVRLTSYSLVPLLLLDRGIRRLRSRPSERSGPDLAVADDDRAIARSPARTGLAVLRFCAIYGLGRLLPTARRPHQLLVVARRP